MLDKAEAGNVFSDVTSNSMWCWLQVPAHSASAKRYIMSFEVRSRMLLLSHRVGMDTSRFCIGLKVSAVHC